MRMRSPDYGGIIGLERLKPSDERYSSAVLKLGDEIEYFTERLSPKDEARFAALIALYEYVHVWEKRAILAHCSKNSIRLIVDDKED